MTQFRPASRGANGFTLLLIVLCMLLFCGMAHANEQFLPPDEAFKLSSDVSDQSLKLNFEIEKGYYLYQEKFKFSPQTADGNANTKLLGEPSYSQTKQKLDPTFNKWMPVFYNQASIELPLLSKQAFRLKVTYQGCAEAGLCYPPQTKVIEVDPAAAAESASYASGGDTSRQHDSKSVLGDLLSAPKSNPINPALRQASSPSPNEREDKSAVQSPPESASPSHPQNAADHPVMSRTAVEAIQGPQSSDTGPVTAAAGQAPAQQAPAYNPGNVFFSSNDAQIADTFLHTGTLQLVLLCFGLGVLLSLTPCVLPMLPILYAIIAGRSTQTAQPGVQNGRRGLSLALAYVLGTSIVYTGMGVAAGLLGSTLSLWLQQPLVLAAFALLLFVLAVSMFGAFNIQTPGGLQNRLTHFIDRLPVGRHGSTLIMGMLSALIATPCVAAPLAGLLLFISQKQSILQGALALFALAWGQGILLLVLGTAGSMMGARLRTVSVMIKNICGLLLLATALWLIMHLLPAMVAQLAWAFLLVCFGLVCFSGLRQKSHIAAIIIKTFALLLIVWGILITVGAASGRMNTMLKPLQWTSIGTQTAIDNLPDISFKKVYTRQQLTDALAQSDGKPSMVEFYADWCVSCHEMEATTYTDPKLRRAMQRFNLIQIDVTDNSAEQRALMKQHRTFGPPAIFFYDTQGKLLEKQRLSGYISAAVLKDTLEYIQ